MNTSSVRQTTNRLGADLLSLALLGPRLMAATLEQASTAVRLGSKMLDDAMPAALVSRRSGGCCNIPEQDCPPRCVCEITWDATAGEAVKAVIHFRNSSAQQTRVFQFQATPFTGAGNPNVAPNVSPASATLGPGQSAAIVVDLKPTGAFQNDQTYHAEVVIRGAYEQCVCLAYTPRRQTHPECHVQQGDPPVRIRAHHWYDHFQCVEPCDTRRDVRDPQHTHRDTVTIPKG